MPPHIYSTDDGLPKPFQYLHPGIRKSQASGITQRIQQPHVFQQSVTLTASMWDENDSKGNMNWSFDNWRIFGKYSPLLIGIACGFGIVLLITSIIMLWRYCLVSAIKKKDDCKNTYGEITQHEKSLSLRKPNNDNQNELESCSCKLSLVGKSLQRYPTMGSLLWNNAGKPLEVEKPLHQVHSTNNIFSEFHPQSAPSEPLMSPDVYTSHLYLQKLGKTSSEIPEKLSTSTPAFEDLYAKINFSKKKKNRMRKNEAAIIAMSKSRSGQNNNFLELFGSAVVVYNERTAL